jgi:hypothetical protein
MRCRERSNRPGEPSDPQGPDDHLDRLRDLGEDFLAAGDEAIRQGLSTNSEAFVRAVRQHGGQ